MMSNRQEEAKKKGNRTARTDDGEGFRIHPSTIISLHVFLFICCTYVLYLPVSQLEASNVIPSKGTCTSETKGVPPTLFS